MSRMDAWYRSPSFFGAVIELTRMHWPTESETVRRLRADVARCRFSFAEPDRPHHSQRGTP
jgi:hypothetical protein